ncbi:MAG: PD-(D/E)XK nuclease family protein, partial [bacterium]
RGAVPVPPRLMVTGFDEVPPQEAALFEALAAAGCWVERHEPKLQPAAAVRAAYPDPLAEIEAAARWARRLLEQGAPGPIGIVAPRLNDLRADVERIFRDLLSPGEPLRPFGAREPFDISLAPPLAEAPLVQAALLLLRPWHRPAPADEISQVLLSPFFSGAERELTARAALDARLRRWGAPALDWGTVANLAGEGETACPKLREAIEGARAAEGKQPASQSPAQWAAAFAGILNDLGWPGERTQSSAERQAFEAWRECLGEFVRLELAFPRLSRADASTRLRRLAESREFQPKRETAPVQVLGVLESGGLTFSHLWMLGFDDRIWPAPARPNPFLPLGLQRSAGLPHASAQRELAYAEGETRRLLGSAPQAVASHAVLHGDQEFRVSPLLEGLPEVEPGTIAQSGLVGLREAMRNGGPLEVLEDFRVPALPAGSQVRGGVGLFRDQAACPFRAFALHRLHAEPLESPHPGIDAAGRGNTLHHAMDELWGNVKTHAALCELSEPELNRRIDEAAARAVERFAERNRHLAGSRLLELERERLAALIRDFLPSERERQPFEVVAREAEHTASFGGISVQVRVDRIDRLLSGGHIVIDYKTGRSELSSWFGERPREPQLPLYCSSADLDLAGVAYARLSRAALGFRALAAEASLLPKAAPFDGYTDRTTGETYGSAQDLLRRWRGVLDGLGEGFRSGDARVDPREQDSPCRTCPLPALCRVHELALAGTANDEEEADE